jgi:hypothetical protein
VKEKKIILRLFSDSKEDFIQEWTTVMGSYNRSKRLGSTLNTRKSEHVFIDKEQEGAGYG